MDTQQAQAQAQAPQESQSKPLHTLFDRTRRFEIPVPHPDFPNGLKPAIVRFPTDEEWCKRSRDMITVRRSLGRDAVKTEVPKVGPINRELFDKIRSLDDGDAHGVDFDDDEAMKIVERLERCQVTDVERLSAGYSITMRVLGGKIVTHELKIPTQRQIMEFGRAAVQSLGRRTTSETRIMLEPSGHLWRQLAHSVTGYVGIDANTNLASGSGPIPIIHMDAAVTELLQSIQSETEGDDPEL